MKRHQFQSARSGFRPIVEALEDRCVPSCTSAFDPVTKTLTVTGSPAKESIVINDNGTNLPGGVVVVCNGSTAFSLAAGQQVNTIKVDTKGGNKDNLTYNQTGDMVALSRNLSVSFGKGKGDRFSANVDGNLINSFLLLSVTGGGGGDRISGNMNGSLFGTSFLGFFFKGGTGKDTLKVTANNSVNIGPMAQLRISMDGGAGKDTEAVDYAGQMQGALFLDAFGGASGKKNVKAKLAFTGISNGRLLGPTSVNSGKTAAQVRSGSGNDRLSFEVDLSGPLAANSFAEIDGGAGNNTCHSQGFITGVFNCQHMV